MVLPRDVNGKFLKPRSKAYVATDGKEVIIIIIGFGFLGGDDFEFQESPVSHAIVDYGGKAEKVPICLLTVDKPTEEEIKEFALFAILTGVLFK